MLNIEKLKEEQSRLAKKVILKDEFEDIKIVAGVEVIFLNRKLVCSIASYGYKTMELKEESYEVMESNLPYISGFRVYREGKAITNAYLKLKEKPTIIMFAGNGILHPRRLGLASHMGILLDQPSIGVVKKLLCGELKNNKVYLEGKIVGEAVITREHANPIFVSPGHKISLKTSVEIVKNCIKPPHKMPEPLHVAHKLGNKVKNTIFSGTAG